MKSLLLVGFLLVVTPKDVFGAPTRGPFTTGPAPGKSSKAATTRSPNNVFPAVLPTGGNTVGPNAVNPTGATRKYSGISIQTTPGGSNAGGSTKGGPNAGGSTKVPTIPPGASVGGRFSTGLPVTPGGSNTGGGTVPVTHKGTVVQVEGTYRNGANTIPGGSYKPTGGTNRPTGGGNTPATPRGNGGTEPGGTARGPTGGTVGPAGGTARGPTGGTPRGVTGGTPVGPVGGTPRGPTGDTVRPVGGTPAGPARGTNGVTINPTINGTPARILNILRAANKG